MEKEPSVVFYQKELEGRDATAFVKLRLEKLLVIVPLDEQNETYELGQIEPLTLVKIQGKLYGINEQDPEADSILLSMSDVMRYRFSVERFVQHLAEANGFAGSPEQLHRRLYYAGERKIDGSKVAFILAFIDQDKSAENLLLGLPGWLPPGFQQFYVVTPSYCIKSISLSDKLLRSQIYVETLQDFDTLKVDLSMLTEQMPILNPQQEKDYELYQYKCREAIDVTGRTTPVGNNIVSLGNILIELGDVPFLLFLRLVLEIKRDKWGIVSTIVLMDEGYLGDNEHQATLRLRERFKPALLSLNPRIKPNEFIERLRPKTLRLSTHPDLIKCSVENFSEHDDSRVKDLVQQISQVGANPSSPS